MDECSLFNNENLENKTQKRITKLKNEPSSVPKPPKF